MDTAEATYSNESDEKWEEARDNEEWRERGE